LPADCRFFAGSDIVEPIQIGYAGTMMKKRLRVILYGDTLVLAGMRLSLEANSAFEVIAFNGPDTTEQELLALQPDVVIFDTSSVQPQFRYNLIQTQFELQLIGIDPDRDQALVWSGQHLHELSLQDLVDVINQERHVEAETRRRGDTETR
jgi:DNA-binding NarL/FixJ family response regulator